jgi:hypothetical protein
LKDSVCSFNNISKSINIGMTAVKLSIKMCVEGFCSVVDLFVSRVILCPQKWGKFEDNQSAFALCTWTIYFKSTINKNNYLHICTVASYMYLKVGWK